MAVKIRLARHGRHKIPYYRVIVANSESKRSGRNLEQVGVYDTLKNPTKLELNEERIKYWLSVGAQPTVTVARLIEKQIPGYLKSLKEKQRAKIQARRKARKARSGKTAAPAKKSGKKGEARA